jgi:Uma2 family endonuclease
MAETVVAHTTAVSEHRWTLGDLDGLPAGYKCEIIDGVLYMAAPRPWPHAAVVANLGHALSPWVRTSRLGRILYARTGVHRDERNCLDPDLLFLRTHQIPLMGGRPTSAAIAVEVLSPSNLRAPREDRESLFRLSNVSEVWYVDYETRSLEIRRLEAGEYRMTAVFRNADTVTSVELPGLEFPLTAAWEDLGAGP